MEKKVQLTATGSPVNQVNAIKVANDVAKHILSKRTDVLGAIIGRRIARETFQGIAKAESEALEAVGATTFAVRTAVVQRVCLATLSADTERQIKHDVRSSASKQNTTFIAATRLKAVEASKLTDWTDEMDAALRQHQKTTVHAKGSHANTPDWKEIAIQMNATFSTNFTHVQWMHRFHHLETMAKKAAKVPEGA